jgi:hypothetical protein
VRLASHSHGGRAVLTAPAAPQNNNRFTIVTHKAGDCHDFR